MEIRNVTLSIYTIIIQYLTLVQILWVYINQIPLFVAMIVELDYEWIIALFLSALFMMFPSINILFMFSPALQSNLLT